MENNSDKNAIQQQSKSNNQYAENPMTGMLGVFMFFVVMIIIMLVLLHFRG